MTERLVQSWLYSSRVHLFSGCFESTVSPWKPGQPLAPRCELHTGLAGPSHAACWRALSRVGTVGKATCDERGPGPDPALLPGALGRLLHLLGSPPRRPACEEPPCPQHPLQHPGLGCHEGPPYSLSRAHTPEVTCHRQNSLWTRSGAPVLDPGASTPKPALQTRPGTWKAKQLGAPRPSLTCVWSKNSNTGGDSGLKGRGGP